MAEQTQHTAGDEIGQKLNEMLSDPAAMSRLAGMASALASSGVLGGLVGGEGHPQSAKNGDPDSEEPTGGEPIREETRGPTRSGSLLPAASSRHTALLRAVKPYLGAEKQARVDQIMKLLQLAELADTVLRGSGGM